MNNEKSEVFKTLEKMINAIKTEDDISKIIKLEKQLNQKKQYIEKLKKENIELISICKEFKDWFNIEALYLILGRRNGKNLTLLKIRFLFNKLNNILEDKMNDE